MLGSENITYPRPKLKANTDLKQKSNIDFFKERFW